MVVHRYEVATEYEKLLDKGRFDFPLSNHFEDYDPSPIYGLDHIFPYYRSHNLCEKEGFARI
jgi:hypothetical protein